MRKQSFANPFILFFGCLVIVVVLLFHSYKAHLDNNTAGINCPGQIEVLEGSGLLWESLSKQFVSSSLFN